MNMQDEEKKREITQIRKTQDELYSNMDRFTVQVILTQMSDSPMKVDEVFSLQQRITKDITKDEVTRLLNELTEKGYAKAVKPGEYEHTQKSSALLDSEGITKEFLFGL